VQKLTQNIKHRKVARKDFEGPVEPAYHR